MPKYPPHNKPVLRQTSIGVWERVGDRRWQSPAHQVPEKRIDRRTGREYIIMVEGLKTRKV